MKRLNITVAKLMLLSLTLGGCDANDGPEGSPTPTQLTSIGDWRYHDLADPNAPALITVAVAKPTATIPTTPTQSESFQVCSALSLIGRSNL
jgi:hypothetical protein